MKDLIEVRGIWVENSPRFGSRFETTRPFQISVQIENGRATCSMTQVGRIENWRVIGNWRVTRMLVAGKQKEPNVSANTYIGLGGIEQTGVRYSFGPGELIEFELEPL